MSWTIIGTSSGSYETTVANSWYDTVTGVGGAGNTGDIVIAIAIGSSLSSAGIGQTGGTALAQSSNYTGIDSHYKVLRCNGPGAITIGVDTSELELSRKGSVFGIRLRCTEVATFQGITSYNQETDATSISVPAVTVSNDASITVAFTAAMSGGGTVSLWTQYTEQLDTFETDSSILGAFATRTGDAESVSSDGLIFSNTQVAAKAFAIVLYEVAAAAGFTLNGVGTSTVNGINPTMINGTF